MKSARRRSSYLRVVPPLFEQLAVAIETMLDMGDLTIEDVMGRMKEVEDGIDAKLKMSGALIIGQMMLTHVKCGARARM
jgi:hypothetical protein